MLIDKDGHLEFNHNGNKNDDEARPFIIGSVLCTVFWAFLIFGPTEELIRDHDTRFQLFIFTPLCAIVLGILAVVKKRDAHSQSGEEQSKVKQMTELKEMLDNGLITEEDFETAKKRILNNE